MRNWNFEKEWPEILSESVTFGVDPYAICAIRIAENGSGGREFGVLSVSAPSYNAQLRVACNSLRKKINLYGQNGFDYNGRNCLTSSFCKYFASKWAPVGPNIANDPTNLNSNWFDNFWAAYLGICDYKGPLNYQCHA